MTKPDDGSDVLILLLREQRARMVAAVMGAIEDLGPRGKTPALSGDQVAAARAKAIPAMDNFCAFVRDVVKVDRQQALRNEESVRLLAQVHAQLTRIEPILDDLEDVEE